MRKHTPGPWRQNPTFFCEVETSDFYNGVRKVVAQTGEAVSDINDVYEREANARLIAAAPELYEALKDVQRYLGGIFPSHERVDEIQALLAKIDGGEI